jgi:hypothetical protein
LIELLALLLTVVASRILLAPVLHRVEGPPWYQRAKARGRPGIPVVTVLGCLLLMSLAWLIGERRGLLGALMLALWIGAPLAAWEILRSWRRRRPLNGS